MRESLLHNETMKETRVYERMSELLHNERMRECENHYIMREMIHDYVLLCMHHR